MKKWIVTLDRFEAPAQRSLVFERSLTHFGENFTAGKSISHSVPDLNSLCWDYWMSSEQEQKAQVSAPRLHQKLWAAPLCLWGRWEAELWQSGRPSGETSLSEVSQSAHSMPGAHSLWDTIPALSLQEGEVRKEPWGFHCSCVIPCRFQGHICSTAPLRAVPSS